MKRYRHEQGLTLIEVLVALAIVSIALTAIIKATTQNIRATTYLQDKTIAMWVGQKIMNEVRADIRQLPDAPDKIKDEENMLGRNWYWQGGQENTANNHIKKITVSVFATEEEDATPLVTFESYVYHAE